MGYFLQGEDGAVPGAVLGEAVLVDEQEENEREFEEKGGQSE